MPIRGRQVATGDQVVEDDRDAHAVVERSAAIEEDHEGRRFGGIILGRNVDRIIVRRAGIELAGFQLESGHGALGHSIPRLGIGTERVILCVQQGAATKDKQAERLNCELHDSGEVYLKCAAVE